MPEDAAAEPLWPSPWLRGMLGLAILSVLDSQESHGYAIAQSLQDRGFGRVTGGSLYPVLGRLEDAGHVETRWAEGDGGPGRKVYTLTAAGRKELTAQEHSWSRFRDAIDALVTRSPAGPGR